MQQPAVPVILRAAGQFLSIREDVVPSAEGNVCPEPSAGPDRRLRKVFQTDAVGVIAGEDQGIIEITEVVIDRPSS